MMGETVTLKKVQSAIVHLRDNGERVSRRNVRSITGGGMSTVHKLMSELEDFEALQNIAPRDGISERLHSTILAEIGEQIKQVTVKLQDQIGQLQTREIEALDALAEMETNNEKLTHELEEMTGQANQLQNDCDTAETVAKETIFRLEQTIIDLHEQRGRLHEEKETVTIEMVKAQLKLETAEQAVITAEKKTEQLMDDSHRQKAAQTETEQKAAVSTQKATDLRDALVKAEKQIRYLERKAEPRQRK